MAETAMRPETPLHLREPQQEARRLTERFFRDDPMDPEAGTFYERTYLALRVQAYQREMEPYIRAAAHSLAFSLPTRPILIGQDGSFLSQESDPLDPETRRLLNETGAMLRARFELEPTNG